MYYNFNHNDNKLSSSFYHHHNHHSCHHSLGKVALLLTAVVAHFNYSGIRIFFIICACIAAVVDYDEKLERNEDDLITHTHTHIHSHEIECIAIHCF